MTPPPADCPVGALPEQPKPLRSYLDRILFGAVALLLLWVGNRMDSYGNKLDANTQEITAFRERLEYLKEGMRDMKDRLTALEKLEAKTKGE